MNFGGVDENVMTREEFPLEKAREILKDETIAVIGYGVQGPGQSMNLRDNGFNVIVGQRAGKTFEMVASKKLVNAVPSSACSFPMQHKLPYGQLSSNTLHRAKHYTSRTVSLSTGATAPALFLPQTLTLSW